MTGSGHLATGSIRLSARGAGFASAPVPVSMDSLFASAKRQAHRGLRARHDKDHDDAAFHLGTMVEHLLKAVLAHLNPVLIYDKNPTFDSMLQLAGQGQRAKPGHVLRTVGFEDALARTAQVLYPIGSAGNAWVTQYKPIAAARNDAAHLGGSPPDPEQIAQLAVACAEDLLPQIDRQLDDLFGGYAATARSLIEANTTEMERAVQSMVDTARTEFQNKYGVIPTAETESILNLIDVQALVVTDDERTTATCPACARTAIISGFAYLDYPEGLELTPDTPDRELHVMLSAERLDCPTCHLRMNSAFELFAAGVRTTYDERPSTTQDRDYYPDLGDLLSDIGVIEDDRPDEDDGPDGENDPSWSGGL